MIETLLVIPTAKTIPTELQAEFGPLPSAMIPLNNRPALAYILRNYEGDGAHVGVVVDEQQERVRAYLSHDVHTIAIYEARGSSSIGETVLAALSAEGEQAQHVVINFGDTLVQRDLQRCDVVVYAHRRESFRWTSFEIESGTLVHLTDKQLDKGYPTENKVFVGVFEVAAPALFTAMLREAVGLSGGPIGLDPFYLALQTYLAQRQACGAAVVFERTEHWNDFGHLDTYYATRRALSSGAREFNTVSIDARRGSIEKRSRHTAKLRNEIRWYLNIPQPLKRFSPRIFDHSLDHDEPFVIMEYYGYPPLNDVYLHGAYGPGEWELILRAIEFFLDEAHQFSFRPSDRQTLHAALLDMYQHKTFERLAPVVADDRFQVFLNPLLLNGRPALGVQEFFRSFATVADRIKLYQASAFTVLHGDLCLSNILFDRHNATIRVIDPRGDFGGFDVFGDPRYDLAKLSHSIHGDYDFYVNGLFDCSRTEGGFEFRPHLTERHQTTKRLFERWLTGRWPQQQTQVRLIESLLFLSMVPLHADRFESQLAFLARGLELYTGVAVHAGVANLKQGEVHLA